MNRKANISIEVKASNVTIGFDLGHEIDLEFSRSNMEFAIYQPNMVRLPRNENQTYRLNFWPNMWPPGLTLAMNLTLNFQGQIWNLLYLNRKLVRRSGVNYQIATGVTSDVGVPSTYLIERKNIDGLCVSTIISKSQKQTTCLRARPCLDCQAGSRWVILSKYCKECTGASWRIICVSDVIHPRLMLDISHCLDHY